MLVVQKVLKLILWEKHDCIFTPQPLRAPGYCRRPSGRAGGRVGGQASGQTSPVNTLTSIIFHGSFSNLARHLLPYDLGRVRSWRFCLIKYAHNGPFNEPASFGIPGLIFQAKVTKLRSQVGLNMLINTNSGFCHNRQKKFWQIFVAFCNSKKPWKGCRHQNALSRIFDIGYLT